MTAISSSGEQPSHATPAGSSEGLRSSVATALIALGTLFPVCAVSCMSYSRSVLGHGGRRTFLFYAALVAIMLAMLNAGKTIEADEWTYTDFLRQMEIGMPNGFVRTVGEVTGRLEIGFYAISYPLFELGGRSIKVVMTFWTFFIYFVTALCFARLFRDRIHSPLALAIFVVCTMPCVNFALTAQVTRQYAAGAMILASFTFFDRRALSLGLILFAGTVHNSAFVFLAPWLFTWVLRDRVRSVPPWWIMLALLAGMLALGSAAFSVVDYLSGGLLRTFAGSLLDNGEITLFKLAMVVAGASILYSEMRRRFDRTRLPLFYGFFFLCGLLALVWKLPLFLLRFSFYVEFFAAVAIAIFFFRLPQRLSGVALVVLPLIANAFFLVRAVGSPWTYSWLQGGLMDNFVGALMVRVFAG